MEQNTKQIRELTKEIRIGDRVIGGSYPILIQSMTNTKTQDVDATVEQILRLEDAGCEIVRCTVPDMEAAKAIGEIKKRIHIPLVADIHFDYRLAIAAMENGADKIRINPGNIGSDERVRAVYLNGSRTNPNAPKDRFQDYDVVYVVTDTKPYYEKHDWINHFGTVLYMQMPEYMDLLLEKEYTPQDTFGWLAIFTDGNRLDIHISSFDYADKDIRSDRLCRILLDKDGRYGDVPAESDADHYVKKPTADKYSCECNEFYWCLNNIGKGLARGELTYAMDMLYDVVRPCLSVMLGWKIGAENDWSVSVGKSDKYMNRYLTPEIWHRYLETVPSCEYETIKRATETMIDLFEETAKEVAEYLGTTYNQTEADAAKEYFTWVLAKQK